MTMTNAPTLPYHPQGFLSVAQNLGIKDTTLDFTVIYSTVRAAATGMFTQSLFCGAPIIVGREHLADGYVQALVINSKNANVATDCPPGRDSQLDRSHWPPAPN